MAQSKIFNLINFSCGPLFLGLKCKISLMPKIGKQWF